MGGGISGHNAGMHRRPGPGEPVHPRHRRVAVDVRVMPPRLLHDREGADESRMGRGSRRYRRTGDQSRAAIDIDLLLADGDDDDHRLLGVDMDDRLVGAPWRVSASFRLERDRWRRRPKRWPRPRTRLPKFALLSGRSKSSCRYSHTALSTCPPRRCSNRHAAKLFLRCASLPPRITVSEANKFGHQSLLIT